MKASKFILLLLLQAALLAAQGTRPVPSLASAREFHLAGNLKEAAAAYATLTVLQPKLEEAHVQLIRISIAANDVAGAAQATRLALNELPNSATVLAAAGDFQFRISKFLQAAEIYKHALQLNPNSARAYFGLGRVNQLVSMKKTARDLFLKAYELDPNDPEIALARARVQQVPREVAAALEQYLSLPDYRTAEKIDGLRQELIENRYLDQRSNCRISSVPAAATIAIQEIPYLGLQGVIFPGQTAITVPVSFNNTKAHQLRITSDGTGVTIGSTYADELKLPRIVDSPPGRFTSYLAFAEKLRIANVELSHCVVAVVSGSVLGADGGISLSLLKDFRITFDLNKHSLHLVPNTALPAGSNPDFQDAEIGADEKEFSRVFNLDSTLLIPARVNGGDETLFELSIGDPLNLLSPALNATASNGGTAANLKFDLSTCTRNCVVLNFERFAIRAATQKITDSRIGSRFGAVEIGGVLGYNALKGVPLTIDYRNGLVKFVH